MKLTQVRKISYFTLLLPVLLLSLWLRLLLIDGGGQYYWPDENRYLQSRKATAALISGDYREVAGYLYSPDHFLFKVFMVIPALAEYRLGTNPRIPAYFLALVSTLNIWLLWQVARRTGSPPREAFIVAGLFAASNSFFYYSRHLLPYDLSTTFLFLSLLVAVRKPASRMSMLICGVAGGSAVLIYNGYWATAVFILFLPGARPSTGIWKFLRRTFLVGVGFFLPFLMIHLAYYAGGFGSGWLRQLVAFSGTVVQGSYSEGWRLPWEYLWHSEHFLLFIWCASLGWALWSLKSHRQPPRVLLGVSGVIVIYLLLVLFSTVLHKFVVYGRVSRQLIPFFCILAGYQAEKLLSQGRKFHTAALVAGGIILVQAAYNFSSSLKQTFPREFLTRAGNYLLVAEKENFALIHARHIFPEDSLEIPITPVKTVLRENHPLEFLPYQYEGYNQEQRRRLRSGDIGMRFVIYSRETK